MELTGMNEIGVPRSVLQVGVGSCVEQHEGNVLVAVFAGEEEGGHAVLVDGVDVGRLLQELLDDGDVVPLGGYLQSML